MRNQRIGFGVLLLLGAATSARAQSEFEGVAVFKSSMGGKSVETTYYSKGRKVRQETSLGTTSTASITDYSTGKSITLIPAQKKYMVMDYQAMGKALKPLADKLGEKQPVSKPVKPVVPQFTATGERETIAGHSCEHYLMKAEPATSMDFCVAKDLGFFMMAGGAAAGRAGRGYAELANEFKNGFFALKTTIQKDGKVQATIEAIRIERKSVPAEMFEPPPGYTAFTMPKIPGIPGLPGRPNP